MDELRAYNITRHNYRLKQEARFCYDIRRTERRYPLVKLQYIKHI